MKAKKCRGKRCYRTADEAICVCLHRTTIIGRPLRIYRCDCGSFHLTSRVPPARKANA